MDKLRAMETFIAVVECGSFTKAARLEMSAVMVGKYIALIERQLIPVFLSAIPAARA